MKKMMFMVCAVACATVWAKVDVALPYEDVDLYKPGSQKGEVTYVNCQDQVPEAWLRFSMDYFAKESNFKIVLKSGTFTLPTPDIRGNASLFIVDDASLPPMLVAPESRWAMVNMAPLKCADRAVFEARVKKELSRGFAFLCGGAESQFNGTLMSVVKTEQLDSHESHVLPVDVLDRFRGMMKDAGVEPAIYTDYMGACQEGWAAAPTNDVQKAIWNKVHELPTKPIKIIYDPAKGE